MEVKQENNKYRQWKGLTVIYTGPGVPRLVSIRSILGLWESKVPKNGRFPAQFTASFILAREIRANKRKANSRRYIHTLHIGIYG